MRTTFACLLGAAVLALAGCGGSDRTADSAKAEAAPSKAAATKAETIDRDLTKVTYEGEDGETALDLLESNGYDVEVETSDLGSYVTAIGDVKATKSKYWLFYVDGKMPDKGADVFKTEDGQQVEWRYGS